MTLICSNRTKSPLLYIWVSFMSLERLQLESPICVHVHEGRIMSLPWDDKLSPNRSGHG